MDLGPHPPRTCSSNVASDAQHLPAHVAAGASEARPPCRRDRGRGPIAASPALLSAVSPPARAQEASACINGLSITAKAFLDVSIGDEPAGLITAGLRSSVFGFLEGVKEDSLAAASSLLLESSTSAAAVEFVTFAASLGQWEMVEAGVRSVAHLYPRLRDSGRLERLDDELLNMLRTEYVRYSQHGGEN
ncbi:hypothetical protein ZWY2020_051347 [Hordeum vulgare]|nr:hypothetical protein ZWY2020_054539 [Hordeum vulgare]KAI4996427.1 hypothetical protein ZWY2020_051347 [Hordeum vulgare]